MCRGVVALLCLVGGFLLCARGGAQSSRAVPFTFEMPEHPGLLRLNGFPLEVTEMSAKPNGREFGIRAEGTSGGAKLHFLGFLFVWPEAAPLTAESCRDRMLSEEAAHAHTSVAGQRVLQTKGGVTVAIAEYMHEGKGDPDFLHVIRAFVAEGDLCADLEFSAAKQPDPAIEDSFLRDITFEPKAAPEFWGQFLYAKLLEQHHALTPAAHVFELAAANAKQTDDPLKWQRVATDQASTDYGMSGDLQRSRALNEAAIARDPDYPLYYYNLACADAEEGKAYAAKAHLQQAFARRANTLKGETLPDPAKDDSIQKLRSNKEFWSFVESLSKS